MGLRALIFACLSGMAFSAHAEIRVVDGDTLVQDGVTYRLEGIDAPEVGQTCRDISGASWDCGQAASDKLSAFVTEGLLQCESVSEDGYGRKLATCRSGQVDLGAAMVSSGMAWAFTKYSDSYLAQESEAKAKALGIWSGPAMPPWDYRSQKWAKGVETAPNGCPIKGNISAQGRIYHPPWSPWYDKTRINIAKGERWFCDEAEALDAGWRAPHWQ